MRSCESRGSFVFPLMHARRNIPTSKGVMELKFGFLLNNALTRIVDERVSIFWTGEAKFNELRW